MNRALDALLGIWRPSRTRQGRAPHLCPAGSLHDGTSPAPPSRLLLVLALFASSALACAGQPTARENFPPMNTGAPVPLGDWGGPHALLRAEAQGAMLEFDCAFGRIEAPLLLDAEGRFSAIGTFTPETGGPLQSGQAQPRPQRARYDGWTDGRELRLTVTVLAEPEWQLGPFTLRPGRRATLEKCL